MTEASDDCAVTGELLPEYRPAWEIQIGWDIRMEDGNWLRVTGRIDAHSQVPERDDVVVLWLGHRDQCAVEAADLIMSRYVPAGPIRVRDMTAAEVEQARTDLRNPT